MDTTLVKHQIKVFGPKEYSDGGSTYRITATVRYDDRCNNGHNTFSVTASIDEKRGTRWIESGGGCCHETIAKVFPELAPFIKWHLVSSDGPMHYVGNTVYHAGDRDCWGLRKGETRQIRNGKTGQLAWKLEADKSLPVYVDADTQPLETATMRYVPWNRDGEGKARELQAARSCAVWPDATDEELLAPDLEARLRERLPRLMDEFRKDVESLGFTF